MVEQDNYVWWNCEGCDKFYGSPRIPTFSCRYYLGRCEDCWPARYKELGVHEYKEASDEAV